jgi:D-lactate dehydrogenase
MKILYSFDKDTEKEFVSRALSGHEIIFHKGSLQEGPWAGNGIECLCVFVNSRVGKEEIDKMPDLKLIATRSTGFDHIDAEEAKKRNIAVANVPTYGEHTVAEFAFALLLTLSRRIFEARKRVIETGSFSSDGLTGFDLKGKIFGVIGTGNIGRNTIRIALGFDMNVLAFDINEDREFAEQSGFKYVSLDEVIKNSDIISLHLPENEHTHHLINTERINQMKPGVIIINTARGALIDTVALVDGLEKGIIDGAGLDVLSEEGYVADEMKLIANPHPQEEELRNLLMNHYLIDHPKVIITPHTAFNTAEALGRILGVTIENIKSFDSGTPENLV